MTDRPVFHGWARNQNGTYLADYCGKRLSVQRYAPRSPRFTAKVEGLRLGDYGSLAEAQQAAVEHAFFSMKKRGKP